ncbi:hypothetical protein MPSI1_002731 [Malassezia psittaci]|uniref:RNI-like protein n=1 Tax=Malassezia psittaci TaxID=1821823 RepID=A0AAF0FD69_9BASI|nr:hypothetical protein MPSI1_002731 [Malassezia psittaci]
MSPFPPTYNENLSRRSVPQSPEQGIPTLKDLALNIAARYFSTHIIPTYDRFAGTRASQSSNKPHNNKRQRRDEDYVPEDHSESSVPSQPSRSGFDYTHSLCFSEINRDILKHMPPVIINELFEAICLHSPTSLTKDIISTYFLPHVAPEKERGVPLDNDIPPLPPNSRIRTRIFFPASLPLFSQDLKAASLMLSVFAGSLALSPSSARLTSMIHALDFHGLTRLPTAALIRLLRAPPRPPRAQIRTWNLSRVTLPGCTAIGDAAITTLADAAGPTLEEIDLAMTSITTAAITTLGTSCPRLRSLRLAWCEGFGDKVFSEAISACVSQCANMTPPLIPFQRLVSIDISHTSVGNVGIAGLLHLCGTQLESLDLGWTKVAEDGSLDMLSLGLEVALNGLQLDLDDTSLASAEPPCTRILYLNGTGLRDSNLQALIPCTGALRSVYLDDTQITGKFYRANQGHALNQLINTNPYLSLLSLSQCRGIPVRSRRSYFDADS